jgi:hypothetical protein
VTLSLLGTRLLTWLHKCQHQNIQPQSEEKYGKSKWQSRRKKRDNHAIEGKKLREKQEKRRLAKLRQLGRVKKEKEIQGIKPESLETDAEARQFGYLLNTQPEKSAQWQSLIAIQLTYFASLSVSTNWKQVTAATAQMLAGTFSPEEVAKLLPVLSMRPESDDSFSFASFKEMLVKVKDAKASLNEIPMWKQITRSCALLTLFGLRPEHLPMEDGLVKKAAEVWMKRVEQTTSLDTVVDMVLDTIVFSSEFYQSYQDGTLDSMLRPGNLLMEANELLAMKDSFLCGQLVYHGTTEARYETEVFKMLTRLESVMRSRRMINSDAITYRRLHSSMIELYTLIRVHANVGGLRNHPPAVVVYGESHVGKSSFSEMLIVLAAHWLGFECEDKNIYYPAKGDEYDSGYTGEINAVLYDDIANVKSEFQDNKERHFFIRFANTMKTMSVQAELETDGRIPIEPKFCVGTTNKQDLDIFSYSNKPSSQFNRFFAIELRVKEQYRFKYDDGSTGEALDAKYTSDEISFKYHEARFYTYIQKQSGGRTNAKKNGSVKNDYVLTREEWLDIPEFLIQLKHRVITKHKQGEQYLQGMRAMKKKPICKKCGIFESDCRCPPVDIEPEAFFGFDFATEASVRWINFFEAVPGIQDFIHFYGIMFRGARGGMFYMLKLIFGYFIGWLLGTMWRIGPFYTFIRCLENIFPYWEAIPWMTFREWYEDAEYAFWRTYTRVRDRIERAMLYMEWLHIAFGNRIGEISGAWSMYFLSLPLRVISRDVFLVTWFAPAALFTLQAFVYPDTFELARRAVLMTVLLTWLFFSAIKQAIRKAVYRIVSEDATSTLRSTNLLMKLGGGLVVGYYTFKTASQLLSTYVAANEPEGNLIPSTKKEVEERQAEVNPWLECNPAVHQFQEQKLDTMTFDQVVARTTRNVVRVIGRTKENSVVSTNAIVYDMGLILLPNHSLERLDPALPVTIQTHPNHVGGKHSVFLTNAQKVSPDIVIVQYTGGPTFTSMKEFFPPSYVRSNHSSVMVTRNDDGSIKQRTLCTRYHKVLSNGVGSAEGSFHRCSTATRPGDCLSPVIRQTSPCFITDVHMGGSSGGAASFKISREDIEQAILSLPQEFSPESKDVYIPVVKCPPIETERYGKKLDFSPTIHERSCTRFSRVDEDGRHGRIIPIASHSSTRFQSRSCVQISPLSEFLEPMVPRKHGPPKIRSDRNHSATYAEASKPFDDVHPDIMDWAMRDYVGPIVEEFDRLELGNQKPLSLDEAVNGVPGTKFIRRMNMKTSIGTFLTKKKINHFELVETSPRNRYECPDYIQEEFYRTMEKMRNGIMDRPILKTALKDEPTKLTKEWVRVFMVSPCYNILVGRSLLLPLMEQLYAIPLVTGMWQGVNSVSDEWDQLFHFMREYSEDCCLEGDYSKWDMRMSGQTIRAVAAIFRYFSKALGYSKEDQIAVETYICDVANSTVLFNGTLIAVDGYNPSGTPPTTAVNGIGNNLMQRCAFYVLWKEQHKTPVPAFRHHVRLGTMGDDAVASVRNFPQFNMRNIQRVLQQIHLPYTDSAKNVGEKCLEYISIHEISFCKRKWRYEPLAGMYVAPIELDSIFKSLHCMMESKEEPLDIVVQVVDGALRELARHDDPIFDQYSAYIRSAVEQLEIAHMVPHLYTTRPEWWRILNGFKDEGPDSLLGSLGDEAEVE